MLRRLFSKIITTSPADVYLLEGKRTVNAVGESHYQNELSRICGGKRKDGHHLPVIATLRPEPDNPYDPNAVGVVVNGLKVGHLDRKRASRLQQPIARLAASAGKPVACHAQIVGGWKRGRGEEGHFGIKLYFNETQLLPQKAAKSPAAKPKKKSSVVSKGDARRAGRLWQVGAMPDGVVHDRHFTEWVPTIKHLKREGQIDEAIQLLRQCADAAEDESTATGLSIPTWYFEQLAICFRKQKDFDAEVAVLERYCSLPHDPGSVLPKLVDRLAKARELQERN